MSRKFLLPKVHNPQSVLSQERIEPVIVKVGIRRKYVGYDSSFHLGAVWPLLSSTLGVIPSELTDR